MFVSNQVSAARLPCPRRVQDAPVWSSPLDDDDDCFASDDSAPAKPCRDPALAANMIFGTDEEYKPTYFIHTVFNTKTWELLQLSICSAEDMYAALCKEAYPTLVAKRTCVHLSPRIYLQRKGGGKKDHSPDDIQLKIKSYPSDIMVRLETTLPPEEQVPELR
jgi:hypothetical protein